MFEQTSNKFAPQKLVRAPYIGWPSASPAVELMPACAAAAAPTANALSKQMPVISWEGVSIIFCQAQLFAVPNRNVSSRSNYSLDIHHAYSSHCHQCKWWHLVLAAPRENESPPQLPREFSTRSRVSTSSRYDIITSIGPAATQVAQQAHEMTSSRSFQRCVTPGAMWGDLSPTHRTSVSPRRPRTCSRTTGLPISSRCSLCPNGARP